MANIKLLLMWVVLICTWKITQKGLSKTAENDSEAVEISSTHEFYVKLSL